MKRFWAILMTGLLVTALAVPALAWEVDLKGKWLWGYDYIDQADRGGFFGNYDTANAALLAPATAKFNAMNAWVGFRQIDQIQYGLVTGADAALGWSRMEIEPDFRINPAVRIRGAYQIGFGERAYGLYPNSASFGAWQPIGSGSWTQLWMTAQTPWGILIAGKRPFSWGMGVQYDGSSATSESLGIVAPYGPMRIGVTMYPQRTQSWISSLASYNITSTISSQTAGANSGALLSANPLYRVWDRDAIRQLYPGVFATYESGPLSMGVLGAWHAIHQGPQSAVLNVTAQQTPTFDHTYVEASAFVKYNNGRFFFNAEIARLAANSHYQPAYNDAIAGAALIPQEVGAAGDSPRLYAPFDSEAWKWGLELGALCGPTKVSLLWSWVPGPDRRHGIWIKKQSWENVANGTFLGNTQLFLPYSLLMGYQYGAGLNATNRNGEGYMTDANSYGARVDYAVAANLNVYATFFYADRVSGGWPVGILSPQVESVVGAGGGSVVMFGQGGATLANLFPAPQNFWASTAPNIPDNSLGWEITTGADWKLLEGLTVSMRGAYWNVGNWFKYACLDRSTVTGTYVAQNISNFGGNLIVQGANGRLLGPIGAGAAGNPFAAWGVNPDRTIDPIWMFQGTMLVDF